MAKLLGVNIPKLINQNLGKLLFNGTLTRRTPGTRMPDEPNAGTKPTEATYTFKGFYGEYDQMLKDRDLVRKGQGVVLIVAESGTMTGIVPKPNDKLVLTDDPHLGSTTATIAEGGVHRDPAGATWLCEVKL